MGDRQLEGENSNSMKVHYDAESDILMFILLDQPPSNAIAQPGGITVSYNANNEPTSIEFLNALSAFPRIKDLGFPQV